MDSITNEMARFRDQWDHMLDGPMSPGVELAINTINNEREKRKSRLEITPILINTLIVEIDRLHRRLQDD